MRWPLRWKVGLLILCGSAAMWATDHSGQPAGNIPILTVCDALRDPAKFHGQTVVIVGCESATEEGSWLVEDCDFQVKMAGKTYRPMISTTYFIGSVAPPPQMANGFRWNKAALRRALDHLKATTALEHGDHWVAAFGRFESEPSRTADLGNGRSAVFTRYGHLAASPAQLVSPPNASHRLK